MSSARAGDGPSLFETIKPILVLVIICVVAGTLLGVVHQTTAPIALANAEQRAQEIYNQLFPDATSFEEVECTTEGSVIALKALDSSGSTVGCVVVAQSKGYGGQVPIAVAFDSQGNVTNIAALENSETPGLGTRIADEGYLGQYVGLPAQQTSAEDINLISGATISSRAALVAFNIAVQTYEEVC